MGDGVDNIAAVLSLRISAAVKEGFEVACVGGDGGG